MQKSAIISMRNLYKKLKVGSKDELVAVIASRCRETQA